MERLTYRDANGELWYSDNGTERDRLHRLAAYEDTGFTPEEIQQMRWISVEERLPEESDGMVLFTNGKAVTSGYRNHMFRMSGEEGIYAPAIRKGGGYMRVTHWMPLPQPPKEGTNGKH